MEIKKGLVFTNKEGTKSYKVLEISKKKNIAYLLNIKYENKFEMNLDFLKWFLEEE